MTERRVGVDVAFLNTIKALAYTLLDVPFLPETPFSLEDSYKVAKQHEISTVFCASVLELSKNGTLELDCEKQKALYSLLLKKSIKNADNFEKMNAFLKNNFSGNIDYALVKGYLLSKLYPFPDYRESCDADVLITKEQEQKAISILKNAGFLIKNRSESGNHSECYHKDYGLLELHVSLFYETVNEQWFGGFCADKNNYRFEDGLPTLSFDDGFLFLVFHSFKHFVSNVFNLKQFFDILLYLYKYSDKLNNKKIDATLKALKIDNFLSAVLTAAETVLGLNFKVYYPFTDSEFSGELLEDMFNGGCFGFDSEKHGDMFEIFHYEKLKRNIGDRASKNATAWRRSGILKTASFSLSNMKKRYPFVTDTPLMLPLAWCKHIAFIVRTVINRPKLVTDGIKYKPQQADDIQKKRLDLIKRMGLI